MVFRVALYAGGGAPKGGPRSGKHIPRIDFPAAEPFRAASRDGSNSPIQKSMVGPSAQVGPGEMKAPQLSSLLRRLTACPRHFESSRSGSTRATPLALDSPAGRERVRLEEAGSGEA